MNDENEILSLKNIQNEEDIIEALKKAADKNSKTYKIIENLEKNAIMGRKYISELREYASRHFSFLKPHFSILSIKKIVNFMSIEDLESLKKSINHENTRIQFAPRKTNSNTEFKI